MLQVHEDEAYLSPSQPKNGVGLNCDSNRQACKTAQSKPEDGSDWFSMLPGTKQYVCNDKSVHSIAMII